LPPGLLERPHLAVDLLERLPDRPDEALDRLLTLRELRRRLCLDPLELRARELEERRVAPLERLRRQRPELVAELVARTAMRGDPLAQHEPDGERAQGDSGEEGDDEHRADERYRERRTATDARGA